MKIVIEGTEEQIMRLSRIMGKFSSLNLLEEGGDNSLPKLNTHYQTENLWSICDVQDKYQATNEEAMKVLEDALTNDATMEQIWFAINHHAEEIGLKEVVEEDRYNATIQWVDNGDIQDDMIFKIGDIEDDDDDVFFYLDSESEIEDFKVEGAHDWIILSIEKIN